MKHILPALVLCLATPAVSAESVAESIFVETALSDAAIGERYLYDYATVGPEGTGIRTFEDGAATIDIVQSEDGGKSAVITLERGDATSELNQMPVSGGNPLVLVFLEQTARAMAELTGGSPYYIRNRMKEALLQDGAREQVPVDGGEATRIFLRPFAEDPNREQMGAFYDIELTITHGDDVPGGVQMLDAQVAGGESEPIYRQTLTFSGIEAPQ